MAELEFIGVKLQILFADLVERAHNAALHHGPEAFNGLRVNVAVNIFPLTMMHHAMRKVLVYIPIAFVVVGRDQAYPMRNRFLDKTVKRICVSVFDYAGNDITFTLDRANNDVFAMSACAAEVTASAFPFVFVLGFAADERFVYFDVADQLAELYATERGPDLVAHEPCCVIRTKSHVTANLECTDSLFAREHKMHDTKPFAQRLVGILEDRADKHGESIANRIALVALPVMILGAVLMDVLVIAARALNTIRPAIARQVSAASIFIREKLLELSNRHLVDLQRAFGFLHGSLRINVRPL